MSGETPGKDWAAGDGVWHIDVRGLGPPLPMVAILQRLDAPDAAGPVIVHHEREPIYLYPELGARGWGYTLIKGDAGEVRLRLCRDK